VERQTCAYHQRRTAWDEMRGHHPLPAQNAAVAYEEQAGMSCRNGHRPPDRRTGTGRRDEVGAFWREDGFGGC